MLRLNVAFGEFGNSPSSEALSDVLYQDSLSLVEVVFYFCGGERAQGRPLSMDVDCTYITDVILFVSYRHFLLTLPQWLVLVLPVVDKKQNSIFRFGSSFIVPSGEMSLDSSDVLRAPSLYLRTQAFVLFC